MFPSRYIPLRLLTGIDIERVKIPTPVPGTGGWFWLGPARVARGGRAIGRASGEGADRGRNLR